MNIRNIRTEISCSYHVTVSKLFCKVRGRTVGLNGLWRPYCLDPVISRLTESDNHRQTIIISYRTPKRHPYYETMFRTTLVKSNELQATLQRRWLIKKGNSCHALLQTVYFNRSAVRLRANDDVTA
jgi:hypothetical protein